VGKWYNAPVLVGLVYLEVRRTLHQKYNLIAVGHAKSYNPVSAPHRSEVLKFCKQGSLTENGSSDPNISFTYGDSFFGRNLGPQPQKHQVHLTLTKLNSINQLRSQLLFPSTVPPSYIPGKECISAVHVISFVPNKLRHVLISLLKCSS
jgi:hypothetical protein